MGADCPVGESVCCACGDCVVDPEVCERVA